MYWLVCHGTHNPWGQYALFIVCALLLPHLELQPCKESALLPNLFVIVVGTCDYIIKCCITDKSKNFLKTLGNNFHLEIEYFRMISKKLMFSKNLGWDSVCSPYPFISFSWWGQLSQITVWEWGAVSAMGHPLSLVWCLCLFMVHCLFRIVMLKWWEEQARLWDVSYHLHWLN